MKKENLPHVLPEILKQPLICNILSALGVMQHKNSEIKVNVKMLKSIIMVFSTKVLDC